MAEIISGQFKLKNHPSWTVIDI